MARERPGNQQAVASADTSQGELSARPAWLTKSGHKSNLGCDPSVGVQSPVFGNEPFIPFEKSKFIFFIFAQCGSNLQCKRTLLEAFFSLPLSARRWICFDSLRATERREPWSHAAAGHCWTVRGMSSKGEWPYPLGSPNFHHLFLIYTSSSS